MVCSNVSFLKFANCRLLVSFGSFFIVYSLYEKLRGWCCLAPCWLNSVTNQKKDQIKEKVKEESKTIIALLMILSYLVILFSYRFYHAYDNYMTYAFPVSEEIIMISFIEFWLLIPITFWIWAAWWAKASYKKLHRLSQRAWKSQGNLLAHRAPINDFEAEAWLQYFWFPAWTPANRL